MLLFTIKRIVIFACILLFSASGFASEKPRLSAIGVKMKVMAKGNNKIVDKIVSYTIFEKNNRFEAFWDEAVFLKSDGNVMVQMSHYSTLEGTIKNVIVTDDYASFDINLLLSSIKIVIRPSDIKTYATCPDIHGFAVYPDGTEEWIITDKIVLTSTTVMGIP